MDADPRRRFHLLAVAQFHQLLARHIRVIAAGAAIGDDGVGHGRAFLADPAGDAAGHAKFNIIMMRSRHHDVVGFVALGDCLQRLVIDGHRLSSVC